MRELNAAGTLGTLGYLLAMGSALFPQFQCADFIVAGIAWVLLGSSAKQRILMLAGVLLIADGLVSYLSRSLLPGMILLVCFATIGIAAKGFEMYAHFKASSIYKITWFQWSGVARILVLGLLAAFSALLAYIVIQAHAPTIEEALQRADPILYHTTGTLLLASRVIELAANLLSIAAFSTLSLSKRK